MRPSHDDYFMEIARVVATRSTCRRRAVGCVLVDHHRRIVSTGYNGVPAGTVHCLDKACPAARSASGTNLEGCRAIHAEINALVWCPDIKNVSTIYVTVSPCVHCVRALLATPAQHLFCDSLYSQDNALLEWRRTGRHVWLPGNRTGEWLDPNLLDSLP